MSRVGSFAAIVNLIAASLTSVPRQVIERRVVVYRPRRLCCPHNSELGTRSGFYVDELHVSSKPFSMKEAATFTLFY